MNISLSNQAETGLQSPFSDGWSWVKEETGFSRLVSRELDYDDADCIGFSTSHTSHRIWVAFFALISSGVSSSTVSPLPFTPSSRSLLYTFYRTEEEQRHCREGQERQNQARQRQTDQQTNSPPPGDKLTFVLRGQSHHISSTNELNKTPSLYPLWPRYSGIRLSIFNTFIVTYSESIRPTVLATYDLN